MPPTHGEGTGYRMNYSSSGPAYMTGSSDPQWTRAQEKRQLQGIHDRFEAYMSRVAELGQQQGTQGQAFVQTLRNVEDSVQGMKANYEGEIDGLRRQIAGHGSEKAEWSASLNAVQQRNAQLQADLDNERMKGDKFAKEADGLTAENYKLNQLVNDLRLKVESVENALSLQDGWHGDLHAAHSNLKAELDEMGKRLGDEERARRQAEDCCNQLQGKLDFQAKMKDQELGQALARLDGSGAMIMDLESRVRELTQNESKVPDMLRRVREAAEEDLQRYKQEAEQEFTNRIVALNDKFSDDAQRLGELKAENDQLNATIADLRGQINTLEARCTTEAHISADGCCVERTLSSSPLNGLHHECEGLRKNLAEERKRHGDQIRDMQNKVEQLGALYEKRIKEVNLDVDGKISLQPEMESLIVLLEGEEKKICSTAPSAPLDDQGRVIYPMQGSTSYSYQTQPAYTYEAKLDHDYTCRQQPCADHREHQYQTNTHGTVGPISPRGHQAVGPLAQSRSQAEADLAKLKASQRAHSAPGDERPQSSTSHNEQTATNSQTGELCIHEVHPLGQYIRIHNTSEDKEMDMSNYQIQQNVGGRPVAVFRFPAKTRLAPNGTCTVWCGGAVDPSLCEPPSDFICNEQQKWGTGPECTTILCKANGQAVAWCTAPHRVSRDAFADRTGASPAPSDTARNNFDDPPLTELPGKQRNEPVFLQREKMDKPSFGPKKHPHGQDPAFQVHPSTNTPRQKTLGNDNSSFNRQTRVPKTPTPDPVPVVYGASATRMGASPLKKPTIRGSGRLINKADYIAGVPPPSSFMKPSNRHGQGVRQLQDQIDLQHQPPMPKPPQGENW